MKKVLKLTSIASLIWLLASCDISFGPVDSNTSSTNSEDSSSIPSEDSSAPSSSDSEDSSSSSSSSEDSSSSSSSSSSSEDDGVLRKTKMAYTYDDFYENTIYKQDNAPTLGNANLLIIPVWFSDSGNYITADSGKENIKEDIEKSFLGDASDTGWHSVRSFFETESMGRLTIGGTVSDWYETSKSSTSVTETDDTAALVVEATNWYFSKNLDDSRLNYDGNSDGYIDSVVVIYGAPDYDVSGSSNSNLWAYTYWNQEQNKQTRNVKKPTVNTFFWSSYDFMYSASHALERTGKSYGGGDNANFNLDCHTFIHEMGHAFGLDDLYDYGPNGYSAAGALSMQDYNVGGHDPYSVMAYGWADPYIAKRAGEYTLKPFQNNHDLLLLTPQWNDYDSPFDEYILVELYTPTGLNEMDAKYALESRAALPSKTGIRIWHVDARLLGLNSINSNKEYIVNAANLTTVPAKGVSPSYYGVLQAFSNTYDSTTYGSPLGGKYMNYNLVQYIRNSKTATYCPSDIISNENMFYDGDTFSMSTFKSQFAYSSTAGKLNSGKYLGWGFSIKIEGTGKDAIATINLYNE